MCKTVVSINVKPTRSELISIKKRIKLVETGHKLLKKKRDGLILEFFALLKDVKTLRKDLNEKYIEANKAMLEAIALDGLAEVRSMALILRERPSVELEVKNVMGVSVPSIRSKNAVTDRGYGIISSSVRMERMAKAYDELLVNIINAAEKETKLRKLLVEIEKTKRRVNSLEYSVMPRLKAQAAFIAFSLEELERENIFRMKRIKQKIAV